MPLVSFYSSFAKSIFASIKPNTTNNKKFDSKIDKKSYLIYSTIFKTIMLGNFLYIIEKKKILQLRPIFQTKISNCNQNASNQYQHYQSYKVWQKNEGHNSNKFLFLLLKIYYTNKSSKNRL